MKTSTSSTSHTPIVQRRLPVMTAAWGTCGVPWLGTLALLLGWFTLPARADINWDGDDPAGNFSSCDNWYSDTCPGWGFGSGNLVFNSRNNGSQTSLYYDLGWNNINDIIWETTFGAGLPWNGSGNGIYFNQRVENRSSYAQTVNIPLSGARNGAPQIELNPVNGDLTISGSISNDNNKPFYSYGSNARMLTIGVGLTGDSSVGFTVTAGSGGGCGKVKLTAAQSWGDSTHGVSINQGEFWIDANGSLKTGIPVSLGLADANPAKLWLSAAGGGTTFSQAVTVANSGGTKVIGGLNTSGTHTFTGNITLNGPVNLVADQPGGAVEFKTGVIGGSGSVNINNTATSAGKIILSGMNTYSGGTTLTAGQLNINNGTAGATTSSAIGTGRFTVSGGSIDNSSSADVTLGPNNGQSWNGDFTYVGSAHNLNLGAGAVSLGATPQITVNSNKLIVRGVISGSGFGLTKAGLGELDIGGTANNTYTGTTTVKDGILGLNASAGVNAFGGDLTINGGTVNYSSSSNNQIPDTANVTVNAAGTLDFGSRSETIGQTSPSPAGSFTVNGGYVTMGSGTVKLGQNPTISGGIIRVTVAPGTLEADQELVFNGGQIDISAGPGGAQLSLRGGDGTGITYQSSSTNGATISNSGGKGGLLLNTSATTVFTVAHVPGITTELQIDVPLNDLGTSAVRKEGAGKLLLTAAGAYNGATTINGGTLALGTTTTSSGSLSPVSSISIAAGATFDVSALGASATYTLGSGASLTAGGTGTTVGTTAAAIIGGSSGTVSLGSRPVTLNYDGAHPALYVSQGKLSLNANSFTVNNVSGTALGYGTYTVIQQASGSITSTGSYSVSVTGSGKVANSTAAVSVSGGTVLLTIACTSPTQLSMSGAGTFCASAGAQTFGVSGTTESDVTYALKKDGTAVDSKTGTGNAITFTPQSATGAYTVAGTRGSCATPMSGSATINATPSAPSPGSDSPVCSGGTLHLSANTAADSYSWTGPNGFTSTAQNPAISEVTTAASGAYNLTVTVNGCASAPGAASVTINAAPGAPSPNVSSNVAPKLSLKINIADLLAAWTGDSLSVQSVGNSGSSTAGGTVSNDSTYIYYLPPSGAVTSDHIPYTVSGANGCSTSANLDLVIVAAGGFAQTITVSGGAATINFYGIPGVQYDVQRATSLGPSPPADWSIINGSPLTASENDGSFAYTDSSAPNGTAYYRSIQH